MTARALRLPLACLLLLLLAACASGGGPRPANASNGPLPAPDSTSASGAYKGATDYRIGAQDLLAISVFGVQELSKEVRVNSNGQISLPLIGGVMAGGRTIPELEDDLAKKYSTGYLQNPQVSVFVKEFASQRITIEGAVNSPGIFPITGPTTLLQAVAIARGFTNLADDRAIIVFRTIKGQKMAALFNIRKIRAGEVEDPRLYGDDIIVVERSGARSAYHSLVEGLRNVIGFRAL